MTTPERPPFRLADEEVADDNEVLRIARDVTRRRPGLMANLAEAERRDLLDEERGDLTPSGDSAVRLALEVGRLRRERDELRAKVARVEALADSWLAWGKFAQENYGEVGDTAHGQILRAALEQP